MDQALQIPEILARIVRFIHDDDEKPSRTLLVSLTQVSPAWREMVQRVVWTVPPVEALASIRSNRRQMFASYVRELDFSSSKDPTLHTLFADLHFTKLGKLVLANPSLSPTRRQGIFDDWNPVVSQYFQPTLQSLKLSACDSVSTASLFKQVAENCHHLRHIDLIVPGERLRSDQILSFFETACHLETIELEVGDHQPSTGCNLILRSLLPHFSRMSKLDDLTLHDFLDQPELFEIIKDQNNTPFQHLTQISLAATSAVMSAAAHVLPHVVGLSLTLQERDVPCFEDLTVMSNLRELTIWTTEPIRFTQQELLAVRELKQLEELEISILGDDDEIKVLAAPDFTDADFDLLVSGLTQLKRLRLDVVWVSRSTSALSSISKHCSKLETLQLPGAYDLQTLNNISTVMFPRLKLLTLGDSKIFGTHVRLTPLQIARLIDHHAPELRWLEFSVDVENHPVGLAWQDA